jgi:dolichol-phosphate mannosyltransferase
MRVFVSVPTYREVENIEVVLRRIRESVPEADILVLDDNSPDGTADKAEALAAELGRIEVLRRPGKMGLGSAYRAGHAVGIERGYDLLVQIDADLSHEPESLPDLIAAVEAGADLAIGSRYVPGGAVPHWPKHRLALSKGGCAYARWVLGVPISDLTAGFRVYRASMLDHINYETTRANGYGFQIEMAYRVVRSGGTVVEVPIRFTDRERGSSKMSWAIVFEAMLLVTWWGLRDRVIRRVRRRGRR